MQEEKANFTFCTGQMKNLDEHTHTHTHTHTHMRSCFLRPARLREIRQPWAK